MDEACREVVSEIVGGDMNLELPGFAWKMARLPSEPS